MSKNFKVNMTYVKGRLDNKNPFGYKQFLALLEEGEELTVEFKRKKFEKTNAQLRMAYLLLAAIKQETGNTIQGLDLWVKHKMGVCYTEKIEGEDTLNCKSKADFSKEEMETYINHLSELALRYRIAVYPE